MSDVIYPRADQIRGRLTDMGDGCHEPRLIAHPPFDLLTDGGDGPYRRLRVDVGQTGFFAGREFRTFFQADLLSLQTAVIHAAIPVDIILFDTSLSVDSGTVQLSLYAGGTAAGDWTALPVIRKNTMSVAPVVAPQVSLKTWGTHTGGVLIDVLRLASGKASSVGATQGTERGVGPGQYYYHLTNLSNQTANVIFTGWWEERV